MTHQELIRNDEKRKTVIRVIHNRENPFVQLNKQALWDSSLSLKAVGLWARCMSRPTDWTFCISELVKKSKEGRRAIDAAMQELIQANYACRIEYYDRGEDGKFKNGGVEYIFFEFPATEEEKSAQLDIFKKSFRHCGFGNRRNGNCRNDELLIKTYTKIDSKEYITPPTPLQKVEMQNEEKPTIVVSAKADGEDLLKTSEVKNIKPTKEFSAEVKEVTKNILDIVVKEKTQYRIPKSITALLHNVDLMLRIDERTPTEIYEVLIWALNDFYYAPGLLNKNLTLKLRENFVTYHTKMNSKPPAIKKDRVFAPCSDSEAALEGMRRMNEGAL